MNLTHTLRTGARKHAVTTAAARGRHWHGIEADGNDITEQKVTYLRPLNTRASRGLAVIATLPSALCLMGNPPCSMMVLAPAHTTGYVVIKISPEKSREEDQEMAISGAHQWG
jgi:hypothetical protein